MKLSRWVASGGSPPPLGVAFFVLAILIRTVHAGFRGGAGGKSMAHGMQALDRDRTQGNDEDAAYLMQSSKGCYLRTNPKAPEQQLISELLKNYNPDGRPLNDPSKAVNVTLQFFLMQINELDEKSQVLSTTGWLELNWHDDQLVWDPANFSNITTVVMAATNIWLPDVALDNTATKVYDLSHRADFRVLINHTGNIWWPPGGRFATACQVDVSYYPFDHQKCVLKFTNWAFQAFHVNLSNGSSTIGLEYFHQNGEWDVLRTVSYTDIQHFTCCPEPFTKVHFDIYLRRKSTFYLMNVLLPFIMISFLILMVFCLPPEAGEKVSLGTTLLLSFSVFQLLIADNMPQTSQYIPVVSIYLTIFMAMTTTSIILSVVILRIHHHGESTRVPVWLRFVIFRILARCVMPDAYRSWMKRKRKRRFGFNPKHSVQDAYVTMNGYARGSQPVGAMTSKAPDSTASKKRKTKSKIADLRSDTDSNNSYDNLSLLDAIDRDVREINELRLDRMAETTTTTADDVALVNCAAGASESWQHRQHFPVNVMRNGKLLANQSQTAQADAHALDLSDLNFEWRLIAKVMDKFFFITFTIIMTLTTTIICWEVIRHQ